MNIWKAGGAAAAVIVAASASADMMLLDIPTGTPGTPDFVWSTGGDGITESFLIESESLVWRGGGHATDGVVRAWDYENDAPATGVVTFTALEGWVFERLEFDISGFKEYEREASVQIYLEGELFRDFLWNFDGNSTLIHWGASFESQLGVDNPNQISIAISYFDGVQYAAGLDNIRISTVPAPGALALLGLAGIVGGRRRRSA